MCIQTFAAADDHTDYYTASDDVATERIDAIDMGQAIRRARDSWESAEPGAYDVEVIHWSADGERMESRIITVISE